MDTHKIINEWFYRLPKGYANYPYSDKELAVLHKVLKENDFQLDQSFLEDKEVSSQLEYGRSTEKQQQPSPIKQPVSLTCS